jgi:hypothetical protein
MAGSQEAIEQGPMVAARPPTWREITEGNEEAANAHRIGISMREWSGISQQVRAILQREEVRDISTFSVQAGETFAGRRQRYIQEGLIAQGRDPNQARDIAALFYQRNFMGEATLTERGQTMSEEQINNAVRAFGEAATHGAARIAALEQMQQTGQMPGTMMFRGMNIPEQFQSQIRPLLEMNMQARQIGTASEMHDFIQNESIRSEAEQERFQITINNLKEAVRLLKLINNGVNQTADNTELNWEGGIAAAGGALW